MLAVGGVGNAFCAFSKQRWARCLRPRLRHRPRLSVIGCARSLPKSIAFAGHLNDRGVREEAIEDRGGGRDVAEKDPPILRRPIGGDERRGGFVPTHEDLQEILGRIRAELFHPEVFKDEQVDTRQLLDEVPTAATPETP